MRALNLDRNNEIFHYKYGKALENEGDVSRARNEYQEAILINPNYEEAKEALQNLPG